MIAILIGITWYLIVALIYMSLVKQHLVICLLLIYMSSLGKWFFTSSAHFIIVVCFFDMFSYMNLYILAINPLSDMSFEKYLLLPCRFSFHFVYGFFHCAKAFYFDVVPFVYFCICSPCVRREIQKILPSSISKRALSMLLSRNSIVSGLISLIYFEFIFAYGVRKYFNFIF